MIAMQAGKFLDKNIHEESLAIQPEEGFLHFSDIRGIPGFYVPSLKKGPAIASATMLKMAKTITRLLIERGLLSPAKEPSYGAYSLCFLAHAGFNYNHRELGPLGIMTTKSGLLADNKSDNRMFPHFTASMDCQQCLTGLRLSEAGTGGSGDGSVEHIFESFGNRWPLEVAVAVALQNHPRPRTSL
jgi:hypothetical protein